MLKERIKSEVPQQELLGKLRNPLYLPARQEIIDAFTNCPNPQWEWENYCQDESNPVFEFLNQEFIEALAEYLSQRVNELSKKTVSPVVILEVAAGNGRLSHFLDTKMRTKTFAKYKFRVTDSGEWEYIRPVFPIEIFEYDQAVEKIRPQIVVCSWMPRKDWTTNFRKVETVVEYILIGDTNRCGTPNSWYLYISDGFEKHELTEISRLQICFRDTLGMTNNSNTVSFKRI